MINKEYTFKVHHKMGGKVENKQRNPKLQMTCEVSEFPLLFWALF